MHGDVKFYFKAQNTSIDEADHGWSGIIIIMFLLTT